MTGEIFTPKKVDKFAKELYRLLWSNDKLPKDLALKVGLGVLFHSKLTIEEMDKLIKIRIRQAIRKVWKIEVK